MERKVTIVPEAGLHARPASKFVETANQFDCEIQIAADGEDPVDARSMLGVTSIGAEHGDEIRLIADGDDAEAALDALEDVLSTPEDEFDDE
jgi:phosphocarrier protein